MSVDDKIKQILKDKNLSPSQFADEIGVQRSSISHILSGRNRPSFDIIQKIMRRYPDLGYDWILEEDTPDEEKPSSSASRSSKRNALNDRSAPAASVNHTVDRSAKSDVTAIQMQVNVERVLVFYTDGTFREYLPT